MDDAKLKKANDLNEHIRKVERRLLVWEKSTSIKSINLVYTNSNYQTDTENFDDEFINFEVLKALTVDAIKKTLTKLKTEFQNL